jgi:hypothetical protein
MNQEVTSKIQKHVLRLLLSIRTGSKASERPAPHGSSSLTDASCQALLDLNIRPTVTPIHYLVSEIPCMIMAFAPLSSPWPSWKLQKKIGNNVPSRGNVLHRLVVTMKVTTRRSQEHFTARRTQFSF